MCVDERGCFFEKATLCAFSVAKNVGDQVKFLQCMDTRGGRSPLTPAKVCATATGLAWDPIQTCYDGEQGNTLLTKAQETFKAAMVGALPYIFVNGKYAPPDYDDVKKAICAASLDHPSACA